MDRRFLAILAAIILIFVGFLAFSKNDKQAGGNQSQSSVQATNHVKGDNAKNVTLVEYGDYQCSACYAYEPMVKQVFESNSANTRFQFRHLPLVSVHANAFSAARAAEAAGLQNKFWEMHDMLYSSSNWQTWTESRGPRTLFEGYAQQLGLNLDQFKKDFESSAVNDMINADVAEFNKTGQQMSTPSYFLNGRYVDNSQLIDENKRPSAAKLQALLDAEFAKSQ